MLLLLLCSFTASYSVCCSLNFSSFGRTEKDHINSVEPQLLQTLLPLSSLTVLSHICFVISLLYIIKLSQNTSFILVICFCTQSMFVQNQFILDSLLFTTLFFSNSLPLQLVYFYVFLTSPTVTPMQQSGQKHVFIHSQFYFFGETFISCVRPHTVPCMLINICIC